jgi:hypothetical protein
VAGRRAHARGVRGRVAGHQKVAGRGARRGCVVQQRERAHARERDVLAHLAGRSRRARERLRWCSLSGFPPPGRAAKQTQRRASAATPVQLMTSTRAEVSLMRARERVSPCGKARCERRAHLRCVSTPHTRSWRSYTAASSSVSSIATQGAEAGGEERGVAGVRDQSSLAMSRQIDDACSSGASQRDGVIHEHRNRGELGSCALQNGAHSHAARAHACARPCNTAHSLRGADTRQRLDDLRQRTRCSYCGRASAPASRQSGCLVSS